MRHKATAKNVHTFRRLLCQNDCPCDCVRLLVRMFSVRNQWENPQINCIWQTLFGQSNASWSTEISSKNNNKSCDKLILDRHPKHSANRHLYTTKAARIVLHVSPIQIGSFKNWPLQNWLFQNVLFKETFFKIASSNMSPSKLLLSNGLFEETK
jgi:hypothetical protein